MGRSVPRRVNLVLVAAIPLASEPIRWVSKLIRKKHNSSVTSVAWHPNNVLLATTSTDGKCRVFCTFIKDLDKRSGARFQHRLPISQSRSSNTMTESNSTQAASHLESSQNQSQIQEPIEVENTEILEIIDAEGRIKRKRGIQHAKDV